jgi:hypothetical protein
MQPDPKRQRTTDTDLSDAPGTPQTDQEPEISETDRERDIPARDEDMAAEDVISSEAVVEDGELRRSDEDDEGELPEEDDDNPYQESDEALPDDSEERAISRKLFGGDTNA